MWGARERSLERELRAHLEQEAEEQREAGLSPEQARYAAQRAFVPLAHQFVAFRQPAGVVKKPPCQTRLSADGRPIERAFRQRALRVVEGIGGHPGGNAWAANANQCRGASAED